MNKIETPAEIIKRKKKTLIKDIIFVIIIGIAVYFILSLLLFDPMGNNYKRNESLNIHYNLNEDLIPEPTQKMIKEEIFTKEVKGKELTIKKIAEYDITGKVDAIQYYNTNSIANFLSFKGTNIYDYISPIDVTLTWGELALNKNGGHITMDQFYMNTARVVWYKYDNVLAQRYDKDFINSHLSNNHIISFDNGIRNELLKVKLNQIIRIKGYLVGVECSDGSHWGPSSTSRRDSGNGACEIILVDDFLVMK